MKPMIKPALIGLGCAALLLAGCDRERPNSYRFEGNYYPAKAKSIDSKDRSGFTANVRGVSQGLEGARQAAAYEATKYCVNTLGTSDVTWTVGPDAPIEAIQSDKDSITVTGTCVE
jgi:hypothetical protein